MAIDINVTVKVDENLEKILNYALKILKVEETEKGSQKKEAKKVKKANKVEITLEEIQKLAIKKSTEGKKAEIKRILKDLNVDKTVDLPKEKYRDFYERMENI